MDPWKLAEVSGGSLDVHVPLSREKLTRVTQSMRLADRQHVLDIGCGTGWMLFEWAGFWLLDATGVDRNPRLLERARARGAASRAPVRWELAVDGGWSVPDASQAVITCLGGTDVLGGYAETVAWGAAALQPGGRIAVGAPHRDPRSDPLTYGVDLVPLTAQIELFTAAGLEVVGVVEASSDDWDRHSSDRWGAVASWLEDHPDDPDAAEVAAEDDRSRREYFERTRTRQRWAVLIARRPGSTRLPE